VIVFDKRGTGLSDRNVSAISTLEDRMDDIRAVMDAAGSEQAAVLGMSEGGPLAIVFAATFPERVRSLVLAHTFARLPQREGFEQDLAQLEQYWGSGLALSTVFIPGADREWAARYERAAATPRAAASMLRFNATIDVRAALPAVSAPTLVIHRTGDPIVPLACGREVAAGIAGAQFDERVGDGHMPTTPTEWDDELGDIEEFLTGARAAADPDRVLATVLFTDIVDSTARAASEGDAAWRGELERHYAQATRLLGQHRGRQVKSTGDGILATFDGPARAIRCATEMVGAAARTGLPIRAGLHAGEVEVVGDDIAGIAVHIAQRVEASARPGQVVVSQTVRDLIHGSTIELDDLGARELKGVPGEWRLFAVR
jgi:class 3 adenylate cyclase